MSEEESYEDEMIDDDEPLPVEVDDGYDDTYMEDEYPVVDEQVEIVRTKSYEVISESVIENTTGDMISEVVDVCGLPSPTFATTLLRHYSWNKEKLIQDYTCSANPEKITKESGITSLELEKKLNENELKSKHACLICLDEVPGKDTFALACGHRYCSSCWKDYLEFKIATDTGVVWTNCPSPNCTEIVHDQAFKKLVSSAAYENYTRAMSRSLVEDNPHIKFCPAPGCTNAIKVERKGRKEAVECGCGFRWCFMCADFEIGDHMPATCENVESWAAKAMDESENVKWMIANTKKCPLCRKPIEKNGGCMHMTCRKEAGGCGHEFCWLCRGDWKQHGADTGGYYACNKYDSSTAKEDDTQAAQLKTELETYMFYYHRYESHHNAMKIADQQRAGAETKATEILRATNVRAQDTNFLKDATEQLLSNRRVLKWSYVYGFYLDKSKTSEKNLFEYLQEDLEKHTNKLSELYEKDFPKDYTQFIKWKEEVTNYTRVTSGFLKKFVEGVMGGLTAPDDM
eukprot:TRINITY_DN4210_c0_g2_i1.p2 TRINITY_DN4210_c0_g2~~TRINITY_DN4210_c0_g2_i1.p2  ORF type:complete len:515 (+),score=125.77 TRINITY_DN4210_c0_g2_i1:1636-3180(+)